MLERLYWYTLEFGLVEEDGEPRAYGSGLLSSFGELGRFETAAFVKPFDPDEAAARPYDPTDYQAVLYVVPSLAELRRTLTDWLGRGGLKSSQVDDDPHAGAAELRVDPAAAVLLIVDVQERLAAAMDPPALAACERNILILIELGPAAGHAAGGERAVPARPGPHRARPLAGALEAAAAGGSRCSGSRRRPSPARRSRRSAAAGPAGRRQAPVAGDRAWRAHVCVWQTVRGLLALGRSVQVVEDAVLSRAAGQPPGRPAAVRTGGRRRHLHRDRRLRCAGARGHRRLQGHLPAGEVTCADRP